MRRVALHRRRAAGGGASSVTGPGNARRAEQLGKDLARGSGEPFVDVMPAGSHPDTRAVRGANVCRIAVHRPHESGARSDTVVVLSVIDNLVKGASGQAVQNMNIMFGLPETAGLEHLPIVP